MTALRRARHQRCGPPPSIDRSKRSGFVFRHPTWVTLHKELLATFGLIVFTDGHSGKVKAKQRSKKTAVRFVRPQDIARPSPPRRSKCVQTAVVPHPVRRVCLDVVPRQAPQLSPAVEETRMIGDHSRHCRPALAVGLAKCFQQRRGLLSWDRLDHRLGGAGRRKADRMLCHGQIVGDAQPLSLASATTSGCGVEESLVMRIAIGSDHAGFGLKAVLVAHLTATGHDVADFGTDSSEPVDYGPICANVARSVVADDADRGIVLGGSGQGEQIAANKVNGARAALCHDLWMAIKAREHNDANVLSMGSRVVAAEMAVEIVDVWLATDFEGGRHQRRVEQLRDIEASN